MKSMYLYPLWIRVWHWLTAVACLLLVVTGLALHFADKDNPIISFDLSIVLHNIAGVIMTLLYIVFIVGNLRTKNGIHYRIRLKGFIRRNLRQAHYYLIGIFRDEPHPFPATEMNKFNPLQQLTYVAIMYGLVSLLVLTGVFLLFPEIYPEEFMGIGTILPIALLHTVLSYMLFLFMLIHVYIATTGHTIGSNYHAMITGWHNEPDGEVPQGQELKDERHVQ